ncbi:hypothetical protein Lalb_Chr02g0154631 [Lupinus albus]|uniref:Uncharacterized protein n=1 Tax=Lupinus albus TaxID=3870 RepID=A0A6A4R0X1_LUPAL|nr:hypothetical protein Lalb_Chr02g0154631 [Lupinus albus]
MGSLMTILQQLQVVLITPIVKYPPTILVHKIHFLVKATINLNVLELIMGI